MPDRTSPISVNVVGTLRLGKTEEDERRLLTELIAEGRKADQAREGWLDMQRRLTRLRYGIRKPKSFPWPNASNLSIPFVDQVIRKLKPMFMRLIVEPEPITEFVGEDSAAVAAERLAETMYNWLFKIHMNALEPMAYIIDRLCHRGFAIAQVGWDYQTDYECRVVTVSSVIPPTQAGQEPPAPEQIMQILAEEYDLDPSDPRVLKALAEAADGIAKGAEFVKLAFKRVTRDRPCITDLDPVQVIAPPRTTDPAQAEWLIVQHVMSLRRCQQLEADGFFIRGSVAKIREGFRDPPAGLGRRIDEVTTGLSQSLALEKALTDEKEKIWDAENEDQILLWEIYHHADHDGDGLADRVVTFVHPKSMTKMRAAPYFYPFREWPIVKFDFEKTDRRWNAPRGVSAMLKDLQRAINAQHNNRLDGMALRNAPTYQVPAVAGFRSRGLRIRPGEVLEMQAGARLEPIIQDRGSYPEMVNEENMLRSIGETYIGTFDSAITSPSSATSARTATEIQAVTQHVAATSTLDAILFQMHMRQLHEKIWALWLDLGPEEVSIKVLGSDPQTNEAQLQRVRKADINHRYKLIPTGTIANTNRALELANAREAIALFVNDQTGLIDKHELYRWYLNLLTFRWARRILRPPDQAASVQMMEQAAQALAQDPELQAELGMNNPTPPEQPEQEVPAMGESAVT